MNIQTLLASLPISVAYKSQDDTAQLPFAVYIRNAPNQRWSDNQNYIALPTYTLEYYFSEVDLTTETAIETMFKTNGISYSKSEDVEINKEVSLINYVFTYIER